jgi:ATP-dependent Lon protease
VEDGLVQKDKPYAGTRTFGMAFNEPGPDGGLSAVGTLLHIRSHTQLKDGRLLVESTGGERFKIASLSATAPVVVATVETLPDDDGGDAVAAALATAVGTAFTDLLRLNLRLGLVRRAALLAKPDGAFVSAGPGADEVDAAGLAGKGPAALSWWVASHFVDSPAHQQALLQEVGTRPRLRALLEVLAGSARYLRARAAVEGALAGGGGGEDPAQPPAGGPD